MDEFSNGLHNRGAAYIFKREGTEWIINSSSTNSDPGT